LALRKSFSVNNLIFQTVEEGSKYGATINRYSIPANGPFVVIPMPMVSRIVAKDFNGDGVADLIWENSSTGEHAIWFFQNGAAAGTTYLPMVPAGWRIVAVGDLNGDGFTDLIWESDTGEHAIWFMKNSEVINSTYLSLVPPGWHVVGAGRVNGGGSAGLIWENTKTGERAIWYFQDGAVSATVPLPSVPVEWHIAGVGDFNGDGTDDLVWENASTGERAIWFMKSGSNGLPPQLSYGVYLPPVPAGWHIAGTGDFDGDGMADLVWENSSTGEHAIWFLKNGILASSIWLPTTPLSWHIVNH
jgi:hypothetical protein